MATYNGRRAPNVSQYIANLNTIPSAHDIATQEQEGFNIEDDLATFTNAEFLDFDLGEPIEQPPIDYDPSHDQQARRDEAATKETKNVDFINGDFTFTDLSPFDPSLPQTTYPPPPLPPSTLNQPLSPFSSSPQTGDKRKYSISSPTTTSTLENTSRAAAEEDKRRRNTAASARFRVKKKQREQALERTAKEMTDKADALEAKIAMLEMENKWLRNLVVEKNGKEDVAALWRKFKGEAKDDRSKEERKDGVGTAQAEETMTTSEE